MLSHAKQVVIHAIEMNALKTGSLKPSDWVLKPFQPTKHHFTFSPKNNTYVNPSMKNA
jgi:hypothetical protein